MGFASTNNVSLSQSGAIFTTLRKDVYKRQIEARFKALGAPVELIKVHNTPDGNFLNGIPNPLLPECRDDTRNAVIKHGADTVSYTHLDVYKRQSHKWLTLFPSKVMAKNIGYDGTGENCNGDDIYKMCIRDR